MLLIGVCPLGAAAQLLLNEVCSGNGLLEDSFDRTPDWIELYNSGAEEIDLEDYFLSDDENDYYLWQLPDMALESGAFIVLFSEGDVEQSPLHFNFGISNDGEVLFLAHGVDGLMQSLDLPKLRENDSYGLSEIDNAYRYFDVFSASGPNTQTPYLGYSEPPIPVPSPGVYASQTAINFEAINGEIYTSTEGHDQLEDMTLTSADLIVSQTNTIRAIAQVENYLPSDPIGASYLIAPAHDLPIICLGVDPYLFFDETVGIHSLGPDGDPEYPFFGANFWKEIELAASLEYFVEGERVVNQQVGIEIHGGKSSRSKDQKPLRLSAKTKYGEAYIDYPVFATKPNQTRFSHWVLRNSGADFLHANYRDAFWHEIAAYENFDFERFGFQPAVVYINGEYWGIMNIREKVSPTYLSANIKVNKDSVLVMEKENYGFIGDSTLFDPLKNFIFDSDLNVQANFDVVADQFDLNSYLDYFILEFFSGNPDWPANNIKYWKPSASKGKWRYIFYDLDTSLRLYEFLSYDFDLFDWVYGEKSWATNAQIFINLMENDEFKRNFINRFADYMNTRLTSEKLESKHDSILGLYEQEMEAHFLRWAEPLAVYEEHSEDLIPGFFPVRQNFVRSQIVSTYDLEGPVNLLFDVYPEGAGEIKLNTLDPRLPFEGVYFNGNAIDLSVTPAEGKRFVNWHYSEGVVENGQQLSIQKNFPFSGTITAIFEDGFSDPIVFFSNPTESYLNGTYEAEGRTTLAVYSSDGRLMVELDRDHNQGKHLINLTLEGLSSGVYLFEIQSDVGQFTKRFVVQ